MPKRIYLEREIVELNEYKLRLCSLAAHLSLFHGFENYQAKEIVKLWTYSDEYPTQYALTNKIKLPNIKWYIYNFVKIEDPIWNPDFIFGLTKCGNIDIYNVHFNSFVWSYTNDVCKILNDSPFFGAKSYNWDVPHDINEYRWSRAAILSAKHSEESLSFMAGVLATGKLKVEDGFSYIQFNKKSSIWLKKWNIPIEHEGKNDFLISPFWTALFTPWMTEASNHWKDLENPYMANKYALIMWNIFSKKHTEYPPEAIPYLWCRRKNFYKFGSIKDLGRQWVENHLSETDLRIRDAVQFWAKKIV